MLTRADAIKMAKEAGFNVGKDAGGEYVAPQYADSVGTLERLVSAAYQAGLQAERTACADLVRQLRDSITWLSHDSGAMRSALDQAENHIRARDKAGKVIRAAS